MSLSGKLKSFLFPEGQSLDFAPALLRLQQQQPEPLPRVLLYLLLTLFAISLLWSVFGQLDVVAVAQGKLVPQSFLKIVQPAEAGIVRHILVAEGESVKEGQLLMSMDTSLAEADMRAVRREVAVKRLQLQRIDAELRGQPMKRLPDTEVALFDEVEAQFRARRRAHMDTLATEQAQLSKARHDLKVALEVESKLKQTAPIYREQAEGWDRLARDGFAGKLLAMDRQRQYLEISQDLKAQEHAIAGLKASIDQAEKRLAQLQSGYLQQLQAERSDIASQHHRAQQEYDKQSHRSGLLELRAPQAGIVKDLATHTPGTVVAPGTVVMTLVPRNEPVQAEVWVANADAGFVVPDQKARVKIDAYPFQKYGMVEGLVKQVSADSSESAQQGASTKNQPITSPLYYRVLVALDNSHLERNGTRHLLMSGMQVSAEIHLGTRSVMEYLLSPIQKVMHEAGRER
jgi:hemolysin D